MGVTDWSSFGRLRALLVVCGVVAFGLGFATPFVDPPIPDRHVLAGVLVLMAAVGVTTFGYVRRLKRSRLVDERSTQILLRGMAIAWSTLVATVGILSVVLIVAAEGTITVAGRPLPIGIGLAVLAVGSVAMREVAIEYYRRQM